MESESIVRRPHADFESLKPSPALPAVERAFEDEVGADLAMPGEDRKARLQVLPQEKPRTRHRVCQRLDLVCGNPDKEDSVLDVKWTRRTESHLYWRLPRPKAISL